MATIYPATTTKAHLLCGVACALAFGLVAAPASAQPRARHHDNPFASGVTYGHVPRYAIGHGMGGQALVSDGPGTGFGFHRLPAPYRIAGAIHRDRQSAAVRDAVTTDALTNGGPYGFGYGGSVYGYGNRASYGVFSGADGYGSPYFAGWYGPGGGRDLGPLGHTYD